MKNEKKYVSFVVEAYNIHIYIYIIYNTRTIFIYFIFPLISKLEKTNLYLKKKKQLKWNEIILLL